MFMVIPSVVMLDRELSMSAQMLYGVITWKCNQKAFCWQTNRALGEILGLSPKRVSALLSDLETQGHIETEIIRDEETGQVLQRNIYPIVKSSKGIRNPIPKNKDTPLPGKKDTSPRKEGEPIPKNAEEKDKEENINNIPPKAPPGGANGPASTIWRRTPSPPAGLCGGGPGATPGLGGVYRIADPAPGHQLGPGGEDAPG